ncbi:hypothetical protein [Heyndrickxia acidiproducens]|uniref:hypothetical protein n=1 Tax=Heyndrickxia acidiproducens TaxID=1121084 RepID=UPI00035D5D25|nr:hypothetical protein [Heyndrickxia acidiproducens]
MLGVIFKKAFILSFILLLFMLVAKKMLLQLYILVGEKSFFLFSNSYALILMLIMITVLVFKKIAFAKNTEISIYYAPLLLLASLIGIFLVSSLYNGSTAFSYQHMFWIIFSSYFSTIFVLLTASLKINFLNYKVMSKITIFFSMFQCALGVYQYITLNPIFAVNYKGESVLNPIFYLNGTSSSNDYFLALGAKIRAFGMTDSGLTLGLFALLCLSILMFKKMNRLKKLLLVLFLISAVYMTLTRIVYLTLFLLLIYMFLLRKNQIKTAKFIYFCSLLIQVTYPLFIYKVINIILGILSSHTFITIGSRISGYSYFLQNVHLDIIKTLFGSNYVSHTVDFNTSFTVDNEFLKIFLDIGIVGYIIVMFIFTYYLFDALNCSKNARYNVSLYKGLVCFLLTFPFLGIVNVGNYFYFPCLLLLLLSKYNIENENQSVTAQLDHTAR